LRYITNQLVINLFIVNPSIPIDTASRRERRKEARPGELLAAALDLFAEKGFAGTRAEEVAARAGVSKGTLFLYFPSKEELFKAVILDSIGTTLQEGFSELETFQGSSAELVPYLMHMWWERYGATKASGISKLMMSEANNFPELAQFYQEHVIKPGRELIFRVIQRGIQSGEFRSVDLNYAVFSILAPLMFLIMWKHSMHFCCAEGADIDPAKYLRTQADIVVQGLLLHGAQIGSTFTKA
jgi:TetR/AcrR family transcriptional regulator